MRLVVYPHSLAVGGSQLNAIDLAAAVRDRGHEVTIFGQPGPLAARCEELELELVEAPRPRGRPSPPVMRALRRLAAGTRADLVHGYEWTAALEAYWGPWARDGVTAMGTVMSMSVAPFIPADLPLAVGTERIAAIERRRGRARVEVIEPPVDTERDRPGAVDGLQLRHRLGIGEDDLLIVVVSRLAGELKLEGLLAAIDAVPELGPDARLLLVGDGPARAEVEARAAAVNSVLGRPAVVLAGEVADPRPAYAAADVCLGMGGSALRAMAFARPLVVQGERGFWRRLDGDSEASFLEYGWYGIADGARAGPRRLLAELRPLLADPGLRAELGRRGRELVTQRFSLRGAAKRQEAIYVELLAAGDRSRRRRTLSAARRSLPRLAGHRMRRRIGDLVGAATADDFNSRPVALRETS